MPPTGKGAVDTNRVKIPYGFVVTLTDCPLMGAAPPLPCSHVTGRGGVEVGDVIRGGSSKLAVEGRGGLV